MSSIILVRDEIPCVSHRDIAENTANEEKSIRRLINENQADFTEFGQLRFEIATVSNSVGAINEQKTYYLNEAQATLLLTYLRNSEIVRAFKKELVRQFFAMRETLERQMLKPVLDYEGGKVAHILHGFKHEINPTAFLNVGLIHKFEKMFGARSVREFYSKLLDIRIDEIKHFGDEVAAFYDTCITVDKTTFTFMDDIHKSYQTWCEKNGHFDTLNREAFLRRFAKVSEIRAKQKRIDGERPRGYNLRVSL